MSDLPARLLGLDVGTRTIGVAVSDPLGLTAQPVTTIQRRGLAHDLPQLRQLAELYNAERFVVGYPLSLSGDAGPQAHLVDQFAAELQTLGLPIERIDERLTTKQAARALIDTGMRRDKRKAVIDQQAAVLILQGYLDRRGRRPPPPEPE